MPEQVSHQPKTARLPVDLGSPVVSPRNFLLATRDSGYRTTASAVAEFVDNAIQAGATQIDIQLRATKDRAHPVEIFVSDDGSGMTRSQLSQALTFGGSARFNDRSSLGRYGMGLPNAALSQARRVDVYTWRGNTTLLSTLDIDSMADSKSETLPPIAAADRPTQIPDPRHGTAIHLQRCDRLEYRRVSTLTKKLLTSLGRIYRHYLAKGLLITVNATPVEACDPLFIDVPSDQQPATPFGDELRYRFDTEAGQGTVTVRFTELPIEAWHDLPARAKREIGITNAANVSVVRAEREIDSGWLFMGQKRRQNYDDWWRCEVQFDPVLDDLFGLTHTKQQITPAAELNDVLSRDLEPIASALNNRVRRRFELAKVSGPLGEAARTATRRSASLPPIKGDQKATSPTGRCTYELSLGTLQDTSAYKVESDGDDLAVTINERHPVYRDIIGPLAESELAHNQATARDLALMVLALARAEVTGSNKSDRAKAALYRVTWSDVAATFLNS